jgi:hypothetical protein
MPKFLITAFFILTASLRAEITLSRDGKMLVTIVVPASELKGARKPVEEISGKSANGSLAAAEVAHYLQLITGAAPDIVKDSDAIPADRVLICIGPVSLSAALVKEHPLKPEEICLHTAGNTIHILGGDTADSGETVRGTLYAAYEFIERSLGVRWLFPGEHGEVVPHHPTLTVPELDYRFQPPVQKRKVRNVALSREDTFAPILKGWGITMDAWQAAHDPDVDSAWFRRQRLGSRTEIDGGHSYAGFYEKYGKDHPDWFALQPDGTRVQHPPRERLCKSNPELWDEIARLRIAAFKADPSLRTASICPNDGGRNFFCMCEKCRALDPPEAPKLLNDRSLIDPATRQPFPAYPSLTDRVFTFYNEIAKRVRREMPDRYLVAYAYSVYRTPPVRITSLEPNLIIGYVGLNLEAIDAWSKIAPQLYIRPNDLGPGRDLGMPRNTAASLAKAVKFAVDHKAIGFDFDNCHGNWGGHGLDYYVLCKALWNPSLDPQEVIKDYCHAAYGPAAEAMLRYHERLEKVTSQVIADPDLGARGANPTQVRRYYTDALLASLESDLAAARAALGATDADALARVNMAADGVTYARAVTPLLDVARKKKSPEYQARMKTVEDVLKQQALSRSVAALHSFRYLRMILSTAGQEVE